MDTSCLQGATSSRLVGAYSLERIILSIISGTCSPGVLGDIPTICCVIGVQVMIHTVFNKVRPRPRPWTSFSTSSTSGSLLWIPSLLHVCACDNIFIHQSGHCIQGGCGKCLSRIFITSLIHLIVHQVGGWSFSALSLLRLEARPYFCDQSTPYWWFPISSFLAVHYKWWDLDFAHPTKTECSCSNDKTSWSVTCTQYVISSVKCNKNFSNISQTVASYLGGAG